MNLKDIIDGLENDDQCLQYHISRQQRQEEVARGSGYVGTKGYEKIGCYECDGFKKDCEKYFSFKDYSLLKK